MSEILRGLEFQTGELIEVVDPVPLRSAELFEALTREIWSHKPEDNPLSVFAVGTSVDPDDAKVLVERAVLAVDDKFSISDIDTGLALLSHEGGAYSRAIGEVKSAYLEVFNWDDRRTYRTVEHRGQKVNISFVDGHVDYDREIAAVLVFRDGQRNITKLSYGISRSQPYQDKPTQLALHVWDSTLAETGYEGNALYIAPVTEQQELKILKTFQFIGRVALDGNFGD